MAYNVNLGNYLNNLSGNGNLSNVSGDSMPSQNVKNASEVKNAIEQVKNMLVGDIFTGEVMDINGTSISIRTGNGQVLNAAILLENQQAAFSKGEMVTFLVNDKSDSRISLKPLDSSAQELIFANKALEASNLAMNQENLAMIKGLVDLNMPIDKNTLNEVSRLMMKFPDASVDTLLRLYKLEMPVTQENITQFDAYKAYEHDMTGTLKLLSEDFTSLLKDMMAEGKESEAVKLAGDFSELFAKTTGNPDAGQAEIRINTLLKEAFPQKEVLPQNADNRADLSGKVSESVNDVMQFIKNLNGSDSEKLNLVRNLLNNNELPKEFFSRLIEHEDFKSVFEGALKENMFLKPEDVSEKGDVKEFYKKLIQLSGEGKRILENAGAQHSELAKGMTSVKNNLEFMNDLNHQMAYLQIPVKFQEGEAKGDLYVYTNKRSLAGKNDELTALLHLDMEHLGPMDIYVKLSNGNHVSTNFCLESEEMLDFIYEHIDLLTERLNKKGYHFTPTMTVRDENSDGKIDFEKDFLDVSSPVIPVSRYIFDIKA